MVLDQAINKKVNLKLSAMYTQDHSSGIVPTDASLNSTASSSLFFSAYGYRPTAGLDPQANWELENSVIDDDPNINLGTDYRLNPKIMAENEEKVLVRVGAGVVWDDFVGYCADRGWYGVENLSLIPGEVGASAVQNIGAYGVEVKDLISFVETVNIQGVKHVYQTDECDYSYRSSVFKRPEMKQVFVTYVGFSLSKKESYTLDYGTIRQELEKYPKVDLKTLRQVIIDIRESKLPDPKVLGNAGSFFMNPVVAREVFEALREQYPQMPFYEMSADRIKIPAGWMIDQCGWKGKSLGPAAVHDKQALVLVNRGGATGADIVALSDAVRASVRDKFGIDIHPEVNFI